MLRGLCPLGGAPGQQTWGQDFEARHLIGWWDGSGSNLSLERSDSKNQNQSTGVVGSRGATGQRDGAL